MEFLEYYHIIRSRIWLALTMAAVAFVVVTVYQVLPPAHWEARGADNRGRRHGRPARTATGGGDRVRP